MILGQASPKSLLSRQAASEMDAAGVKRIAEDMIANRFSFARSGPIDVAEGANGIRIILDGHHRTAAAIQAGVTSVPIRIRQVSESVWEQLFLQVLEAAGR